MQGEFALEASECLASIQIPNIINTKISQGFHLPVKPKEENLSLSN